MNTAQSDQKPATFEDLGDGRLHFNYDIQEKTEETEDGETRTYYEYKQVTVSSKDRNELVVALIRQKYSADEEYALGRHKLADRKASEFEAYDDYVESCKVIVDNALG